jgi:putative tricarboxylic transport membrane protein
VILGPLAESYFLTTLIGEGNDFSVFFRRPVSACLMVLSFALLLMPALRNLWKKERRAAG